MQVRVSGWATPRSIREENGRVLFEVAETDGCHICESRIEHVRRTLTGQNIAVSFRTMPSVYGPNCLYVVLDAPPQGVDVRDHVGRLLNLSIG